VRADHGTLARPLPIAARLRRAAIGSLPAALQRRLRTALGHPSPRIIGLGQLDAELERAAELFSTSEDDARRFLRGFAVEPPAGRPADPFSEEYRRWVWALYREISGRSAYALTNEASPIDVDEAVRAPYPYSTGSTTVVGEELVARGFIVSSLELTPPARIVEFGSGWGNLTVDLATMGFDVTAVELEERFCALTESRNRRPDHLTVVHAGMLDFEASAPFDAAIFYESFHHCADHLAMLERLHAIVVPDGRVLWAGEPVGPLGYPWGPRLDGYSLWSTRTYGWLELGFDHRYFAEALDRTGWRGHRRTLPAGSPLADVIVGQR
jgi:protein-L-isoaspartate O-methyltransferase